MKQFLAVILFLFSFQQLKAQEKYSFLEKGLKPYTLKSRLDVSLPSYLHTGEKLSRDALIKHMGNPYLKLVVYANQADKPKAIVLEEASEKEAQKKISMYESMPGGDLLKNRKPPLFIAKDLDGNKVDLKDYAGKVVALNFWFIGCKPCIMEMPELNELVEEYKKEGVEFLAIALDSPTSIKVFLKKMDFEYDILPDGRSIARQYGVSGYPTHLLIDKSGKVVFSQTGYFPGLKFTLKKRIKDLLED